MKRIRGRHGKPRVLAVLAALTLALATLVGIAPGAGAANAPGRPTLLVHGYDLRSFGAPSIDCAAQLGAVARDMSAGLSRNVVNVGYYAADANCNMNLHTYGRSRNADYGDRDSWKAIARAMSWYVYDAYTARGIKVDVIGYSMGGLIARGAVYGAQIHEPGFSPPIDVGNAVTLGAPFRGVANAVLCGFGQCSSLNPFSPDLAWLTRSCDAQGKNTTLWTVFGSTADQVVASQSATEMCTWPDRKYVLDNVYHADQPNFVSSPWVIQLVRASVGGQTSRIYAGVVVNRCLDIRYMATANGTPVQSFDCNNTYAQFWTRQATGQRTQIMALGKCLDVSAARFTPGTLVQLWACNGSPAQQWTQYSDRTIRSNGYCLAAPNNNTSNFTQLEIWTCNGGNGELWS